MEYLGALLVGIVSSLVATSVFIGLMELFRRVFLPWYADRIYRGVRLDGRWFMCAISGEELETHDEGFKFELEQNGDQVTGMCFLQEPDEDKPDAYKLNGQIQNGYFAATMWPAASDMLDPGSILLRVFSEKGNLRLKGSLLYINTKTANVKVAENVGFCKK